MNPDIKGLIDGIKIYSSPLAYTFAPSRVHRHRKNQSLAYHKRIQKKWLKRFGSIKMPCAYVMDGSILGIGIRGMVMPPEMYESLKTLQELK